MKRRWPVAIGFSFFFGIVTGSICLLLGIRHNTQFEFYLNSGSFDYGYSMEIFLVWFALGTVFGMLIWVG